VISVVFDFSSLNVYLDRIFSERSRFFRAFSVKGAEVVAERMRSEAPKRSGALAESVASEVGVGWFRVYPTAPYAPFIELGTKPHIIAAERAKALRFWVDGEVVYAKTVHHPGTKPNPLRREDRRLGEQGAAQPRQRNLWPMGQGVYALW